MKILVIRFSSIGDIVLTTPVVRCLKKQLNAEVHYLTKQPFRQVLAANPHLDKIFTIQKKVKEVLPLLRAEKYDVVIDLHHNLRSLQVKWRLGGKHYAFDKINFQKWLIVNFKMNHLPRVHIVDRYLKTVRHLGVVNDGQGLDYFIPPDEVVDVAGLSVALGSMHPPILPFSYLAFVIGAAHATKRLPEHKIIAICKQLTMPVVLLGGQEDVQAGALIAQEAGGQVLNACGKLKLNQSASVIKQSYTVITHDTGLMHIAAAFRKDIISVWGNTIPAFGMYPYFPKGAGTNTSVEVQGLPCRPCSKIGYPNCPKGHFDCMQKIDEQQIISIANNKNV